MSGPLQTHELGDIFQVLAEHELFAFRDDGNVPHAQLEQTLASVLIVQHIHHVEGDSFARKKLFRP